MPFPFGYNRKAVDGNRTRIVCKLLWLGYKLIAQIKRGVTALSGFHAPGDDILETTSTSHLEMNKARKQVATSLLHRQGEASNQFETLY
jgi:hypothetical protein